MIYTRGYEWDCPNCGEHIESFVKPPVLGHEAIAIARRIDATMLQRAMKEAHGRRISTTETYAEAIARRYNAILGEVAK